MARNDPPRPLNLPSHVVSFSTLSKAFGLPGLRVGWCIAPPDLLNRTLALRDQTTLFLSPLVELIAARAIGRADDLIAPLLARARENLEHLDAFISCHDDLMDWRRPQGGVCGLVRILGVTDTRPLCGRLVTDTGVLMMPGSAFGHPDCVRIGYGGDTKQLLKGLQTVLAFLRRWRAENRPG